MADMIEQQKYTWKFLQQLRTLAQVNDFSENTKVSLSNRDCEAPVPIKILIGMELDVSVDNDTEPWWMKG